MLKLQDCPWAFYMGGSVCVHVFLLCPGSNTRNQFQIFNHQSQAWYKYASMNVAVDTNVYYSVYGVNNVGDEGGGQATLLHIITLPCRPWGQ